MSPFATQVAGAWETIDPARLLEILEAFGYERATDESRGVETITLTRGSIVITLRQCGEAFEVSPTFRGSPISYAEAEAVLDAELWSLKEAARTQALN